MDVREKLVELVKNALAAYGSKTNEVLEPFEFIADFMMANGVTVQENVKMSDELLKQLKNAPITICKEESSIETVQEWISVKDRLPEGADGKSLCENVIAYLNNGEVEAQVCPGWLNGDKWYLLVECDDCHTVWGLDAVTHWKPMPQPPKGGNMQ